VWVYRLHGKLYQHSLVVLHSSIITTSARPKRILTLYSRRLTYQKAAITSSECSKRISISSSPVIPTAGIVRTELLPYHLFLRDIGLIHGLIAIDKATILCRVYYTLSEHEIIPLKKRLLLSAYVDVDLRYIYIYIDTFPAPSAPECLVSADRRVTFRFLRGTQLFRIMHKWFLFLLKENRQSCAVDKPPRQVAGDSGLRHASAPQRSGRRPLSNLPRFKLRNSASSQSLTIPRKKWQLQFL
jgi:hypothetical protein